MFIIVKSYIYIVCIKMFLVVYGKNKTNKKQWLKEHYAHHHIYCVFKNVFDFDEQNKTKQNKTKQNNNTKQKKQTKQETKQNTDWKTFKRDIIKLGLCSLL